MARPRRPRNHYIDFSKTAVNPLGIGAESSNAGGVVDDAAQGGNEAHIIDFRNVLPTTYGYTSYFGQKKIDLPALPELTEEVFLYDTATNRRIICALSTDGLHVSFDGATWDDTFAVFPIDAWLTTDTGAYITTHNGDVFPQVTRRSEMVNSLASLGGLVTSQGSILHVSQSQPVPASNPDSIINSLCGISSANYSVVRAGDTRIDNLDVITEITTYDTSALTFGNFVYRGGLKTIWGTIEDYITAGVPTDSAVYIFAARNGTKDMRLVAYYRDLEAFAQAANSEFQSSSSAPQLSGTWFGLDCSKFDLTPGTQYTLQLDKWVNYTVQPGDTIQTIIQNLVDGYYAQNTAYYGLAEALFYDPATNPNILYIRWGDFTQHDLLYTNKTTAFGGNINTPLTEVAAFTNVGPEIGASGGFNIYAIDVSHLPADIKYIAIPTSWFDSAGNTYSSNAITIDGTPVLPIATKFLSSIQDTVSIYPRPKKTLAFSFAPDNNDYTSNVGLYVPVFDVPASMVAEWNIVAEPVPVLTPENAYPIKLALPDYATGCVLFKSPSQHRTYGTAIATSGNPIDLLTVTAGSRWAQALSNNLATFGWQGYNFVTRTYTFSKQVPLHSWASYNPASLPNVYDGFRAEVFFDEVLVATLPRVRAFYKGNLIIDSALYSTTQTVLTNRLDSKVLRYSMRVTNDLPQEFYNWQWWCRHQTAWSKAQLRNKLYIYRQHFGGLLTVDDQANTVRLVYPTFANMQFIQGIASGKGRLIMWDSDNAVYRSSILDELDFEPSIATQATVHKLDSLRGKIVTVKDLGDDYIVYGSASILLARFTGDTNVYRYELLSDKHGIYYHRAVCELEKDVHAVFTDDGLHLVSPNGMKELSAELSELLRTSRVPVRLDFLQGRYLIIYAAPAKPTVMQLQYKYTDGIVIPGVHIPSTPGYFPSWDLGLPDIPVNENYYWEYVWTSALPVTPQGIATHQAQITDTNVPTAITLVPVTTVYTENILQAFILQQLQWIYNVMLINQAMRNNTQSETRFRAFAHSIINPQPTTVPVPGSKPILDPATHQYKYLTYPPRYAYNSLTILPETTVESVLMAYVAYTSGYAANVLDSAPTYWKPLDAVDPSSEIILDVQPFVSQTITNQNQYTYDTWANYIGTPDAIIPPNVWAAKRADIQTVPPDPMDSANAYVVTENSQLWPVTIDGTTYYVTKSDALAMISNLSAVLPVQGFDIPAVIAPGGSYAGIFGTPGIIPPVYTKTLIYDLKTGKFGSCDIEHRCIFEYAPVNAPANRLVEQSTEYAIGYDNFALGLAGVLPNGELVMFDNNNTKSMITVGKFSGYESGVSRLLEAKFDCNSVDGSVITIRASLDGIALAGSMTQKYSGSYSAPVTLAGKWFTATLAGKFDVKGFEYRYIYGGSR